MKNEKKINGVQLIALYEATKGVLIVALGIGLLSLLHRDLQMLAEHFVERLHLSADGHYSHIFIEAVTKINDNNIKVFALIAFADAALRFVQAYGLWHLRRWAEWLTIFSSAIYLPIEIYEIYQKFTVFRVGLFLVNLLIVIYLLRVRLRAKHELQT